MRQRRVPTKDNPYVTFATALNFFDPDQRKMIEHIQMRTNFSDYFKRLVLLDMQGKSIGSSHPQKEESFVEEYDFAEGLMKGVI